MEDKQLLNHILDLSIQQWNRTFGGTSALDISEKLRVSNEVIMTAMESLCAQGKGKVNANAELYVIKFETNKPKVEIPDKATVTHIFFPAKEILTEYFYSSSLVRENYPEYKNRLHQGGNQIELVSFSDEVLTRYYDHPELYEVDDSLSGGHIWAKSEAPENRYLYVRHGKRKLKSGKTAVTAILKDLYAMSTEEQRHWHAYEVMDEEAGNIDPHFARFLARTYEGAFVEFQNPIKDVTNLLKEINEALSAGDFFGRTENNHFRLPVENTEKAYYDCCSELFKLIGPDSLNHKVIKSILTEMFKMNDSDLIHSDSERPLSTVQLLTLLETKLETDGSLSSSIKSIGKNRIEADHKITEPQSDERNYVEDFISLCQELLDSGEAFKVAIRKISNT